MRAFFLKLVQCIISTVIVALVVVIGMLLWPYDVLEIKNVTMLTPEVKVGQSAFFSVDYCKLLNAEAKVYLELIDSNNVTWFQKKQEASRPKNCAETSLDYLIPNYVKPGKYYIHVIIYYKVNFIRDIVEEYQTPLFQVIQ